jgi:hypothetical protein
MPDQAARHRRELLRQNPTFIADGLGPMNPSLAITSYPDLADWLGDYRVLQSTAKTVVYVRK